MIVENILLFIVSITSILILLMACGAIGWLIECVRDSNDEPEQVGHTVWSNVIVESKKTGNRFSVWQDSTGQLWHLGGEETEPQKLNADEWYFNREKFSDFERDAKND
jgi:hypothetical protein